MFQLEIFKLARWAPRQSQAQKMDPAHQDDQRCDVNMLSTNSPDNNAQPKRRRYGGAPELRLVRSRAIISGHGPTNSDGSLAQPLGKVGVEVTEEEACTSLQGLLVWQFSEV